MTNDFTQARQQLLTEIAAEANATASHTGRAVFADMVMQAIARVPREQFVPPNQRSNAYANRALPLSLGQTISQPYIVTLMTDLLDVDRNARVLEIGTGSGYQTAVLAELVADVYSIETLAELATSATARLASLGYRNIHIKHGNGRLGWPTQAPFDAIIITAAGQHIPPSLSDQLCRGGRLVAPVDAGHLYQDLLRCVKRHDGQLDCQRILPVAFVPLTGRDTA